MLITTYGAKDFYPDDINDPNNINNLVILPSGSTIKTDGAGNGTITIAANAGSDCLSTHTRISSSMHHLGADFFTQHIRSSGTRRMPLCTEGEPYYNHDLLGPGDNGCIDVDFNGSGMSYLEFLVNRAHSLNQSYGMYVNLHSDYFFERLLPTDPSEIVNNHDCEAEDFSGNVYPMPFSPYEDEAMPFAQLSPTNTACPPATCTDPCEDCTFNPANEPSLLCHNCHDWKKLFFRRTRAMAQAGADFIFFDEPHTHDKGCYCINCRDYFHNAFLPNMYGSDYFNGSYIGNTAYAAPASGANRGMMNSLQNMSLTEHFGKIREELMPFGTIAAVNVGEVAALSVDGHHRTNTVYAVDIPKIELNVPLRQPYNRVFWGQSGGGSILQNYHIPEDIRLLMGLYTVRDASRYRYTLVWQKHDFLKNNNAANNSVVNNNIYKTMLGVGYLSNSLMSTTLQNYFTNDPVNQSFVYRTAGSGGASSDRRVWSLAQVEVCASSGGTINPLQTSITPINWLDEMIAPYLSSKKPYDYVGIHVSEWLRNRYYSMPAGQVFNSFLAELGNGAGILTNGSGYVWDGLYREGLVWWNSLFAAHGAFQAMSNYPDQDENDDIVCYKFPVSILGDYEITHRHETKGVKALLVPVPLYENQSVGIDPMTTINLYTDTNNDNWDDGFPVPDPLLDPLGMVSSVRVPIDQDPYEGIMATFNGLNPTPLIPVFRNSNWFNTQNPAAHEQLLKDVREKVLNSAGLPAIYVTGHTLETQNVYASFLKSDDNKDITVPLVASPSFSVLRTDSDGVQIPSLPNQVPQQVAIQQNGDLKIHIPATGIFAPNTPTEGQTCGLTVTVLASRHDAQITPASPVTYTPSFLTIPYTANPIGGEYLIDIPAFEQFVVINIKKFCN